MKTCHGSWSDLPIEILDLFLNHLTFADHARFGAVCKSWRSASQQNILHLQSLKFPWVVLPPKEPTESWGFFSPMEGRIHWHKLPTSYHYCSSFRNWFMMAKDLYVDHLFNPITNRQIKLPIESCLQRSWYTQIWHRDSFRKAIFSPITSSDDIFSANSIAFMQCLDKNRTMLERTVGRNYVFSLFGDVDAMFFDGFIYLDSCDLSFITKHGLIRSKNIDQPISGYQDGTHERTSYLVEWKGKLLKVVRYWYYVNINGITNQTKTVHFDALELQEGKWIPVKDFDDGMLFVGRSCSRFFSVANSRGFRKNCIYFFDLKSEQFGYRCKYEDCDQGVFLLEDGTIHSIIPPMFGSDCLECPPSWFMPGI